jgi:hypothetical protein
MEPIRALMIVEMIGRPKEHLEETLKEYIKKISSEKGITLINEKLHEPKKIEHKKDENKEIEDSKKPGASGKETKVQVELFSTFVELEIDSKDITTLMRIIFAYMPSHIEIISPENLELKNLDFNDLFNEVIRKMHEYDGIAKSMIMENKIMREQFQRIINNIKKSAIKVEENLPNEEKKETVKEEVNEIKKDEKVNTQSKKPRKKKESS